MSKIQYFHITVSDLTLGSKVKVTGPKLSLTVKSDQLMNIHAKYQWPKSNNKKVVDLRVQYAILLRPRKRMKNQWKTKARFTKRVTQLYYFARIFAHMWFTSKMKAYTQDTEVQLESLNCQIHIVLGKFPICKYGLQAFICSSYFQLIYT